MFYNIRFLKKNNIILKIINNSLINLPTPSNLNYFYNMGSLLGLILIIQLITGFFLVCHYCPNINNSFESISHIIRNVNFGFILRYTHANGASAFFIIVYLHISKNIFYGSYLNKSTWNIGIIILLLMMAIAFMGYVLPWGQMSYWGCTVITNFITAIPYIGETILLWIWGGYSVSNPTLNRFFSLHYLLPFVLIVFILLHLVFLHEKGSSNPLGICSKCDRIPFHPYYTIKDLLGFFIFLFFFLSLVFLKSYFFAEPDNFIKANPMITPTHIVPEWYFLFAYTILRSIPNKCLGVLALVISIVILIILPYTHLLNFRSLSFTLLPKFLFCNFILNFLILSYIGSLPATRFNNILGLHCTIFYFTFYILFFPILCIIENKLLNIK